MFTPEEMQECVLIVQAYTRTFLYPCDIVLVLRELPIADDLHWVILQMVGDLDKWRMWRGVPFT